jgi:hypothetical protein
VRAKVTVVGRLGELIRTQADVLFMSILRSKESRPTDAVVELLEWTPTNR